MKALFTHSKKTRRIFLKFSFFNFIYFFSPFNFPKFDFFQSKSNSHSSKIKTQGGYQSTVQLIVEQPQVLSQNQKNKIPPSISSSLWKDICFYFPVVPVINDTCKLQLNSKVWEHVCKVASQVSHHISERTIIKRNNIFFIHANWDSYKHCESYTHKAVDLISQELQKNQIIFKMKSSALQERSQLIEIS